MEFSWGLSPGISQMEIFQIRRFPNCLQIRMLNQMSLGFCGDCRKSRYDSVANPKKVAPIL